MIDKVSIVDKANVVPREHRGDFITCPLCEFKMASKRWTRAAHVLVLRPSIEKASACALITRCPKCGSRSWVHFPLDAFYPEDFWHPDILLAADKEEKRRKRNAKQRIGRSVCKDCQLRTGDFNEYNTWRSCPKGIGPAVRSCDQYSP